MCKRMIFPLSCILLFIVSGMLCARDGRWSFVYFWRVATVILIGQYYIPLIKRFYSGYVARLFFFAGISSIVMCLASMADATDRNRGPLALDCSYVALYLFVFLNIINFTLVTLWHHARSDFGSGQLTARQMFYQNQMAQLRDAETKKQGAGMDRG